MLKRLLTMLVAVVAIAGFAQVAHAQYMYLDSNANGIHDSGDVLKANATATTVDVWVDTAHNRDGSLAICDSADGALTINSFVVEMAATGGNVTYSGYINQQAANMPTSFGEVNTGNNDYKNGNGGGTQLAAGTYKLCTVTITGTSGSPSIAIVPIIPGTADFTSFGSACSGNDFDNTLKEGSDWFDSDGLGAGVVTNNPPVITNPGNKTVNELSNLAFTVTATDPDAGQTVAITQTLGSPAATGATTSAAGAFSWTPTEAQGPGVYPITFTATDNGTVPASSSTSLTVTVNEVNTPPVIANPGNKTINELSNLAFTLTATDADLPAQPVTFSQTLGSPAATGATTAANGAFSWTPTEAQGPGVYPVTFTASDGTATNSTSITITVNEVNQAPVLGAIGNKSGTVGNAITFTATATDGDLPAQALTFSLTLGSPAATGATINPSTGAFTWTPSASGSFPVTVTVTDNGTPPLNDFEAILINVGAGANNPPVLAAIGNKTVNELATLAFTATATDPDAGQTLTFSQTLGSPAATGATTSAAGAFSWTPTEAQGPGVYPVTITVTDNGTSPLSDSEGITITVNEVNQAPVITNPGNKTVNELANLAFTVTATDADLPAQTLTFSQTLGSPAATGATTSAAGAFSWTPTEAQGPGVYPITFNVSDGTATSTTSITVTVNEVNVAPVLDPIGNKTGTVSTPVTFTATATDADIPANTLTFSLDAGAPAGATINGSTGAFSWTPSASGSFPVTVRVTDNGTPPLSDFEGITITVGSNNQAPVLAAIGNKTVNELSALTFTATATDPNAGDVLTFSLTLGSPAATGATINGSTGGFSWTPTEAQGPGVYPVTVTVTDNGTPNLSDFEAITITVNEVNQAPVLAAIGNKNGIVGVPVTFTATATDADIPANTLTFSLDAGAPAGATINGSTGAFSWTPSATGTFPVTVRVTDNGTPPLSAFEGITITVGPNDSPPVLTSPGNKTVDELSTLAFTLTATDPDAGATLTFSQILGSPAATGATTSAAGAFSWTPTEAQGPGVYPVTFIVSDGTLTDQKAITITVNEVNQAPVITNPGNKTVNELANLAFTVTATDADLPAQTLTFSQTLGSPAATGATTSAAGAFSWTPTEAQGPGIYPITFNVSDGTATSSTSITITVNEVNVAPVLAPIGNKSGSVGVAVTFTATATDADIPSNTLTFSLDAGAPAGATIDGTTGAFSWTPSASGSFPVTVRVTDNGTPPLDDFEVITISVGNVNHAPTLTQPADMTVDEGQTADQQLTATDPDNDPLTFSKDAGSPIFMTVSATGNVHLAPGFADAGTYTGHVSVSDGSLSDSKTFGITVNNVNRAPVANAGGPYTGTIGNDIHFDGSGSSDPDGDSLTYAWDFGDGSTGTGVNPLHAYSSAGDFTVTLTVTDIPGGLTSTATTTAHVVSSFPATVFTTGGNGSIRLNSGKPQSCVQIQPVDGDFDITNVDLNSVVMMFGSGQISAIGGKTATDGDKNHDGISEIMACFSKDGFRTLFAGQSTGDYSVTITGNLLTGGSFTGNVTLHIVNNGNFVAATISPNPLNPQAVLTFSTSKQGAVRVGLYDVQGRLIRTLLEDSAAQAGYHDVTIDGRDNQGNRLASGVYYVLIQSEVDGKVTKAITILK